MDLDLGPQFAPEADHLAGIIEDRDQLNAGRIPLGISFLDDCLGGVYPGDLVLLGAGSGVGKTALAVQAAMAGVKAGRETYMFALEARKGEVSARLYFEELGRVSGEKAMDYAGWWRGHWKPLERRYEAEVRAALAPKLARLHTLYKGRGDFTPLNLSQRLEAIAHKAGLLVLDHVHVVDSETDNGELRAQRQVVRMLGDLALDMNVPVVAVSHIRKRDTRAAPTLLPTRDDLHGHSNLFKVATQIVLFGRDWDGYRPEPHLSPTIMQVDKDRNGRASTMVARMYFDMSKARYEELYELGRLEWKERRQQWTSLQANLLPGWAERDARRVIDEGMPF